MAEELAVKWFEMIQLGLPSTALAAFFGPLNLLIFQRNFTEIDKLVNHYLPHILRQAQNSQFFMNIYFEKCFEQDCDELRAQLRIKPFISNKWMSSLEYINY